MAKFFKIIGDFFHRIGSDLSRVHVRAAFVDVEHRIEKFFHHQEARKKESRAPEEA